MNFADEEYVRLYVRDTVTWELLGWEGRTVLLHMLRGKFDRAGVFVTSGHELSRAVTAATRLPQEVAEEGLRQVLQEGVWVESADGLVWPGYVHAQTCPRTAKARKREERARRNAESASNKTVKTASRNVTDSHTGSHEVTTCHPEAEAEAEADPPKPPKPKRRAVRKSVQTPFPDDFAPTKAHRERCIRERLNCDHEAERFEMHHRAKGTTSACWNSSFTTWLINAVKFRKEAPALPPDASQRELHDIAAGFVT